MTSEERVFSLDALEGVSEAAAGAAGGREHEFERALRPKSLAEFVGQERVVQNLHIAIRAAKDRAEPLDHILLSGPPGLGKTSLARILARELGTNLTSTTGPALERPRDLVGILTQLKDGDVLFVDEIHRLPKSVEEYLFTAMEDYTIDITLDQGPHARVLSMTLEPFTLVGATTREGLLSAPFRGRFGLFERMRPYAQHELVSILERSARMLAVELEPAALEILAERSRGTPRHANRFLRRVRDSAQVAGHGSVNRTLALETMERLGVDENGLDELDRRILGAIARHAGEPLGLKSLAAAVGEAEDTIEEAFEPYLLQKGYIVKTSRGRMLTDMGWKALGRAPGDDPALFE